MYKHIIFSASIVLHENLRLCADRVFFLLIYFKGPILDTRRVCV